MDPSDFLSILANTETSRQSSLSFPFFHAFVKLNICYDCRIILLDGLSWLPPVWQDPEDSLVMEITRSRLYNKDKAETMKVLKVYLYMQPFNRLCELSHVVIIGITRCSSSLLYHHLLLLYFGFLLMKLWLTIAGRHYLAE